MEIPNKYPVLAKRFEVLCQTKRDEILLTMVETDGKYASLRRDRADTSMALKEAIDNVGVNPLLFEAYSDAVYAQEVYELDKIYRQAFLDALNLLVEQGLL